MTRTELRSAAREARKLAMEIVAGTAPEFTPADCDECPAAEVAKRAGLRRHNNPYCSSWVSALAYRPDNTPLPWTSEVWRLAYEFDARGPIALPWHLLSLADDLDAAARRAA